MKLSPSMQFVTARAEAEAKAARLPKPCLECYFLGLLKLAEVGASDFLTEKEKWRMPKKTSRRCGSY